MKKNPEIKMDQAWQFLIYLCQTVVPLWLSEYISDGVFYFQKGTGTVVGESPDYVCWEWVNVSCLFHCKYPYFPHARYFCKNQMTYVYLCKRSFHPWFISILFLNCATLKPVGHVCPLQICNPLQISLLFSCTLPMKFGAKKEGAPLLGVAPLMKNLR